ncbi:hypothetical protein C5167_050990 [Papaver somniferum]|uniref:Uncharacterized protein n=1 Tax=Papaver somniferum TaxID=3469 RepID=A0A4Y7KTK8_PAPSO|nr:hypothetical protein C5167_050990 [Papaver somniferum]
MGSLRSRSMLPSAVPLPRFANCALSSIEKKPSCRVLTQLSGATEKKKIPSTNVFPETEDQIQRRKLLEVNAEQLTRPAFDLGAAFIHPNKEVMHILSDLVEKNRNSPTYRCHLWKLLTSARLRELGVGYNVIPIPDKQEWKASWREERKPKWL